MKSSLLYESGPLVTDTQSTSIERQYRAVDRALDLESGGPGFKSDHLKSLDHVEAVRP